MTDNEKVKDIIKELMKQKKRISDLLSESSDEKLAVVEDVVYDACDKLTEIMGMDFLEGEKFLEGFQ